MENGKNKFSNKISKVIQDKKKGLSLLVASVMAMSAVGGAIPSVIGLAGNSGEEPEIEYSNKYEYKGGGAEDGTIKVTNSSKIRPIAQQTPSRPLGGGKFTVKSLDDSAEGEESTAIVDANMVTDDAGEFNLSKLPLGKYEVKNVEAAIGYEIPEDNSKIIDLNDNKNFNLVFQNDEKTVNASISKQWTKGSEPVNYDIDYKYFGIDEKPIKESGVLFNSDKLDVGSVMYYKPGATPFVTGDNAFVNKAEVTVNSIKDKNKDQYQYEVVADENNPHNTIILGDQVKRNIVVKKDFDGQKAKNVDVELAEVDKVKTAKALKAGEIKAGEVIAKEGNVGTITLKEKNDWSHTFKDMPRYTASQLGKSISERHKDEDGPIEYTIRESGFESDADGYSQSLEGNEIDGLVIVSKELENLDVTIDKEWVGDKGNKVELAVKVDNEAHKVKVDGKVKDTFTITSADEWTKTVQLEGIPYDAEITIEAVEANEDYDVKVIDEGRTDEGGNKEHKFVVESIERLGSLEILMNKGTKDPSVSMIDINRKGVAKDEEAQDTEAKDEEVKEEAQDTEAKDEEANEDTENEETDKDVEEEVEEEANEGFGGTRLAGAKFLVESKETENGEEDGKSVYSKVITTNDRGLAALSDIPYGEYTITETKAPKGYEIGKTDSIEVTIEETQTRNGYRVDFHNERVKVEEGVKVKNVSITVTKEWEFEKGVSKFEIPEDVKMKLVSKLPNGEIHEESEEFTLNEDNKWTKEFTDMLNVNNEEDKDELEFVIVETDNEDATYDLDIIKTGSYFKDDVEKNDHIDILATNIEALGKINVVHVEGNAEPSANFELDDSVKIIKGGKFELREKDSEEVVKKITIPKSGKFSITNLPYGEYTLTSVETPEGYLAQETNAIDITVDTAQTRSHVDVKFENEKVKEVSEDVISVSVKAEFNDSEGNALNSDSIDVKEFKAELYRNGIEQDVFVQLNPENEWTGSFEDLTKFEVGTEDEFKYSVESVIEYDSALDRGFTTELKGDVENGFVFVNTQIASELIEIPVTKTWVNESEELDEVVVQLVAPNGEVEVIDEITLTAEGNWKGTFKPVPVMVDNNQTRIAYDVVELDYEGYTSKVSGNSDESGFNVQNTQEGHEDGDVIEIPDNEEPTDNEPGQAPVQGGGQAPGQAPVQGGGQAPGQGGGQTPVQGGGQAPAAESNGGFEQTATSAIGLGIFAILGLAGVGAVAFKKSKEEGED